MLTLKEAAERCRVTRKTLKRWLAIELHYRAPRLGRGRYTVLVPERLVEQLVGRRAMRPMREIRGAGVFRGGQETRAD